MERTGKNRGVGKVLVFSVSRPVEEPACEVHGKPFESEPVQLPFTVVFVIAIIKRTMI